MLLNLLYNIQYIINYFNKISLHLNTVKLDLIIDKIIYKCHEFAVYELKIILTGGGYSKQSWSIAFNQDAFFLDSLYWDLKKSNDFMFC